MNRSGSKIYVIGLLGLLLSIFMGYYLLNKEEVRLPIYNPADLNKRLVDSSLQKVKRSHKVGAFKLIDQEGIQITEENFKDKIYVTDFFFTTCPTICPKMTKQMKRVQDEFMDDDVIKFISHSVTPEIDSVETLQTYAVNNGAIPGKWHLVTGSKQMIYELARKSYFAVTTEGDGGENDFIHTENFVLVDKEKRLRGFYDGTSIEDVDRLIDDIYLLKKEYEIN